MMISKRLLAQVALLARDHCAAKGYTSGRNWNPLNPQDSVAAWAMAMRLTGSGTVDEYIAIAPEGHAYGFFFERVGIPVLSIFVDYPPTRIATSDDLSLIRGRRVLLIEDDIVSGASLGLVMKELTRHEPSSVSLYLGREKECQQLQNIPSRIDGIFLAEDVLGPADRCRHESEFINFFQNFGH